MYDEKPQKHNLHTQSKSTENKDHRFIKRPLINKIPQTIKKNNLAGRIAFIQHRKQGRFC